MNLIAMALRICAVEALDGRTLMGGNVLDSQIAALTRNAQGVLETDQEKGFIAVYTNSGNTMAGNNVARPFYTAGTCELAFEIGVSATGHGRNAQGETELIEGIPETDANYDFMLGLVGRQIIDALADSDNLWSGIFMELTNGIEKIEQVRTDGGRGVKLAAHQITLTCQLIEEPTRLENLDDAGAFKRFLDALDAHESDERHAQAENIRLLLAGDVLPDWAQARRRMGLAPAESASLGNMPLETDDGSVGQAESADIEIDGLAGVHVADDA